MKALPKSERAKLVKLLGMLGSAHAGERDNAAVAAHRFVQARGISWRDVVEPPATEKQLPELGVWRQTVAHCLAYPAALRPWEVGFLRDLPKFARLSTKQRYVLKEIAERVIGRDAE